MENQFLTEDEIIKITLQAKIRERAFFTVLRQSGLQPNVISKLKIKHFERIRDDDTPIPCKIDITQEGENVKFARHPSFIGEESVKCLKGYLTKREMAEKEKLTQESLLFITHKKPSKPIIVKEAGRVFKSKAREITKGSQKDLSLNALRLFFLQKTEEIQGDHLNYLIGEKICDKEFKPEDDEFYRELYKDLILDALEIEPITKAMLRIRDNQIKDLTEKIEYILLAYKDLHKLAKPIIDFSRHNSDGEMNIRLTQKTMTMDEAAAQAEQESDENNNSEREDAIFDQETENAHLTKKESKLEQWKRAKKEIESIPREPRIGELLHVVYGDVKVVTTEVSYKPLPSKELQNTKGNDQPIQKQEEMKDKKDSI